MIIPLGIRFNNPANLQRTDLQYIGELPDEGQEIRFDTLAHGIRAFVRLCYVYQTRAWNTPQTFIEHFSPPSENPTAQYLANCCSWTGFAPDEPIDFHVDANMERWARAIFRQEIGPIAERGITDGQIYAGIALANSED